MESLVCMYISIYCAFTLPAAGSGNNCSSDASQPQHHSKTTKPCPRVVSIDENGMERRGSVLQRRCQLHIMKAEWLSMCCGLMSGMFLIEYSTCLTCCDGGHVRREINVCHVKLRSSLAVFRTCVAVAEWVAFRRLSTGTIWYEDFRRGQWFVQVDQSRVNSSEYQSLLRATRWLEQMKSSFVVQWHSSFHHYGINHQP